MRLTRHPNSAASLASARAFLLEHEAERSLIYTDLANPTSNHVYQTIGYLPVCDASLYLNRPGDQARADTFWRLGPSSVVLSEPERWREGEVKHLSRLHSLRGDASALRRYCWETVLRPRRRLAVIE
jgi:hypothetical protein